MFGLIGATIIVAFEIEKDKAFARPNLALPSGPATLTAVARDALGRSATDTLTVTLPGSAAFACWLRASRGSS